MFGFLAVSTLTVAASGAIVLNDGSTTSNLTLLSSTGTAPSTGTAGTSMSSDGAVITLTSSRDRRTLAYSNTAIASSTYTVSAEAANNNPGTFANRRVGLIGWFNTASLEGIGMYRNQGSGELRLRTLDLDSSNVESVNGLFTTGGSALASDNFHSSLVQSGTTVRYAFDFQAPTASDLTALPTVTSRVVASVTSLDGVTTYGSRTFLTNLAAPADHRVGYFGYLAEDTGALPLGRFDNLSVSENAVVPEPTSLAALGMLGAFALRRRGR
jgi:hypothetical protein